MMQPSEPHEHRDRGEPRIDRVPHTAPDLRGLAACIAELRIRQRRLKDELAVTDELLIEARRQAGLAGGFGARKRNRAKAFAQCIAQLERRRDFLIEELAASEIDIDFEIPPAARQAYAELRRRFDALGQCAGMANIRRSVAAGRNRPGRGNARVAERPVPFPRSTEFTLVHSEFAPLHLRNGDGDDLLFFPCLLALFRHNDQLALIDIRQVQISVPGHRPHENRSLTASADDRMSPRHSQADSTARPMPGGAGGRHGRLLITSTAGLEEAFDVRDGVSCCGFAQALASYVATLPTSGGAFAKPDTPEPFQPLAIPARPQLPPPLHHNPWPVLLAGALVTMALVAWRADLPPTAGRLEAFVPDLRGAAAQATNLLVGFLHRDAVPTLAEEDAATRETDQGGGRPPASEPAPASELQPTTATAPPGNALAPVAGSGVAQSAATTSETTASTLPSLAANPPASALEPSAGKPATSPLTRSEVIAMQAKLQALEFQPGSADGIAGRHTVRAVKAFQRAHGLRATGIIDRQILKAILDAPIRQTSSATTAPEAIVDAPKPLPGFTANPSDDLLTASERGR